MAWWDDLATPSDWFSPRLRPTGWWSSLLTEPDPATFPMPLTLVAGRRTAWTSGPVLELANGRLRLAATSSQQVYLTEYGRLTCILTGDIRRFWLRNELDSWSRTADPRELWLRG